MKLTSVEIRADPSTAIVLSFRDPRSINPYNIKAITGLDTDSIIPKFDGSDGIFKFYNLILKKRVIVIKTGLNPNFADDQTYSELRDDLYRTIASARKGYVRLYFKNETDTVATLIGFVSKLETDLFERNQEVHLTIECIEPFLKSPTLLDATITLIDPTTIGIQDDLSSAPHGFTGVLNVSAPVAGIDIKDPDADWVFRVNPTGGFLAGDELHVFSEFNNKKVYLIRSSAVIHLADVLSLTSVWPIIFPGANTFQVNHVEVTWDSISYYPTYWGV